MELRRYSRAHLFDHFAFCIWNSNNEGIQFERRKISYSNDGMLFDKSNAINALNTHLIFRSFCTRSKCGYCSKVKLYSVFVCAVHFRGRPFSSLFVCVCSCVIHGYNWMWRTYFASLAVKFRYYCAFWLSDMRTTSERAKPKPKPRSKCEIVWLLRVHVPHLIHILSASYTGE